LAHPVLQAQAKPPPKDEATVKPGKLDMPSEVGLQPLDPQK
jgi:hypothetical protein